MMRHSDICIPESVKIAIQTALRKFIDDGDQREYEFPSSLTSEERKFVHNLAPTMGIKTKSRGNGQDRSLTAYKNEGSTIIKKDATFSLTRTSQRQMMNLFQKHPLSEKEHRELQLPEKPQTGQNHANYDTGRDAINCTTGRLNNVIPQVPPLANTSQGQAAELQYYRESLPIANSRNDIMETILKNSVVLITGDTGCGKTTQVPQFILEYYNYTKQPCRIIAAEPRRLAAISVADRVAQERGEPLGETVGYQIRLESKVSPRVLLTFCTNGVLLRSLMGGDGALSTITHVIVDEIHERDRFSDLLLTILRDLLTKQRNLKLILMSASCDTKRFQDFFGDCPMIHVPGVCHEVRPVFLEDVLRATGYRKKEFDYYRKLKERDGSLKPSNLIDLGEPSLGSSPVAGCFVEPLEGNGFDEIIEVQDPAIRQELEDALKKCFGEGKDEDFETLLSIFINEEIGIDYKHPETGVTALIAAVCRNKAFFTDTFLQLGASPAIRTKGNKLNCYDWAKQFNYPEMTELLKSYDKNEGDPALESLSAQDCISDDSKVLLDFYHSTFNDEEVDVHLILTLLHYIVTNSNEEPKGAVLIFLPGYDEIVTLREHIIADLERFDSNKYVLYTLHSQMQSSDQKRVFRKVLPDVRKIILSTNLAETSITIDDIVYVIDAGKMKEKSFDNILGVSQLKSVWISQANATQRRGRAGRCRPGVCYHLYSNYRYRSMQKYQVPEILRMPIHELCLQIKLLAPNMSIAEFLAKCPDPPSSVSVRNSISMLKAIDALDPWEQLTELGLHLLDLPVEPNLGKMVLYSVVLKCLDPILTIVCSLAYRDPFVIPANAKMKHAAYNAKKKLSFGTLSDHMVLLRGFQNWQKARGDGFERHFCENHFISSSTMEMIVGMRAQLLGQLRASGFVRTRGPGDIRDLNTNSENWAVVKAVLCAGSYPKIIRVDRQRRQLITQKESKVRFHPSSVLNYSGTGNGREKRAQLETMPSDWFTYEEMTRIGRVSYARSCTVLSPLTVALFAGPARLPSDAVNCHSSAMVDDPDDSYSEDEDGHVPEKAVLRIDEWLSFKTIPEVISLVYPLRQKYQALFLRRMASPTKTPSPSDEAVIKTIVEVLTTEEQVLGIQQPVGVGQRPRPMASDYCPVVTNTQLHSPSQRGVNNSRQHQARQGGGSGRSPRGGQVPLEFSGKGRSSKRY